MFCAVVLQQAFRLATNEVSEARLRAVDIKGGGAIKIYKPLIPLYYYMVPIDNKSGRSISYDHDSSVVT